MTRTLFTGGIVFDGTGAPPSAADIVVDDGRLVAVGADLDGDVGVDLRGRGVLPGLFDCHVHTAVTHLDLMRSLQTPFSLPFYESVATFRTLLGLGITSVRDAGGADLGMKEALTRGLVPGPRMQIAISMIGQTGGHVDDWMPCGVEVPWLMAPHPGRPSGIVDGPDEMRRKVRELVRAGADVIKVATSGGVLSARDDPRHAHFRPDELAVLVAEATAAHRFVMAHAQATDGIKNAVRAGIRSIEHGIFLDDEAIAMMLERGTWLVPTLLAPQGVIDAAEAGAAIAEAAVAKAREVVEVHRESFGRAVAAGVRVAMGTDCPVSPFGTNLAELALMQKFGGLTAGQALVTATSSAAALLGVDGDLGTIEPGKRADLVVVDGDPLEVATLADRVVQVWKDGVQVVSADPAPSAPGGERR